MVKSVKIIYYAESGALWVVHISFPINWLLSVGIGWIY